MQMHSCFISPVICLLQNRLLEWWEKWPKVLMQIGSQSRNRSSGIILPGDFQTFWTTTHVGNTVYMITQFKYTHTLHTWACTHISMKKKFDKSSIALGMMHSDTFYCVPYYFCSVFNASFNPLHLFHDPQLPLNLHLRNSDLAELIHFTCGETGQNGKRLSWGCPESWGGAELELGPSDSRLMLTDMVSWEMTVPHGDNDAELWWLKKKGTSQHLSPFLFTNYLFICWKDILELKLSPINHLGDHPHQERKWEVR